MQFTKATPLWVLLNRRLLEAGADYQAMPVPEHAEPWPHLSFFTDEVLAGVPLQQFSSVPIPLNLDELVAVYERYIEDSIVSNQGYRTAGLSKRLRLRQFIVDGLFVRPKGFKEWGRSHRMYGLCTLAALALHNFGGEVEHGIDTFTVHRHGFQFGIRKGRPVANTARAPSRYGPLLALGNEGRLAYAPLAVIDSGRPTQLDGLRQWVEARVGLFPDISAVRRALHTWRWRRAEGAWKEAEGTQREAERKAKEARRMARRVVERSRLNTPSAAEINSALEEAAGFLGFWDPFTMLYECLVPVVMSQLQFKAIFGFTKWRKPAWLTEKWKRRLQAGVDLAMAERRQHANAA